MTKQEGIPPTFSKIWSLIVLFALVVICVSYAFEPHGMLPSYIPSPAVARVNENTLYVFFHREMAGGTVENLIVSNPSCVGGSLNSSVPTGKIEVGSILTSTGVYRGDRYVVRGTVGGKERVVIDTRI